MIADLWDEFESAGHSGSEAWRFQADRLHSILMEFTDGTGIGPGRAEFVAERRERGVSDVSAHRMLTVARTLPDWKAANLPASMQYQLAKAVEAGGDYAELLGMAQVLSVSDFIDEAFGEKEHAPKLALVCPCCGHTGPRDAFAQRKEAAEAASQGPT